MQAVKNGIKSIFRTPIKSALFLLIIAVLTSFLSIAICAYSSVTRYLDDCDEFYRTVIELEYVGAEYPKNTVYDAAAEQAVEKNRAFLEELIADEGVRYFEPASSSLLLFEGFSRKDTLSYDPNACVMLVHVDMQLEDGSYAASIVKQLYYKRDVEHKLVLMNIRGDDFKTGVNYLVTGRFFLGKSSYLWFNTESMTLISDGKEIAVPAYTEYGEKEIPDDNIYSRLAEALRLRNDACRVIGTSSLTDIVPFNQTEITIKEGRVFTEEEYRDKSRVLILPDRLAALMEVGVGDRVRASLIETDGNVYLSISSPESFDEYEIVGLYAFSDRYPYFVFVPDADADERPLVYATGFTIGSFYMNNADAERFMEKASFLTGEGFRLNLYDQGYSAATEPMKELLVISAAFLAVSLLFVAAALALYGHLFVSRQRDTALTMLDLGSGKPHVFAYFIAAALFVAVPAAALGCFIATRLEARVFGMLVDFAHKLAEQDLRYSSSRITIVKTLEFDPDIPLSLYALAGGVMAFCAAVITFLFALGTFREKKNKKKKEKKARIRVLRSSRLGGALKYSALSIRRNIIRTLAVLLLCIVIAVFFGRLTSSLDGYKEQLEIIKRDTVIKGHAADVTGRMIEGLAVTPSLVRKARTIEIFSESSATKVIGNARPEGVYMTKDGTLNELEPIVLPTSEFALESLADKMAKEPKLEQTDSLEKSPIFYYADPESIEWYGDRSDEDFVIHADAVADDTEEYYACAMPKRIMEKNGIELGDVVRLFYAVPDEEAASFDELYCRVIASYIPVTDAEVIYLADVHTMGDLFDRGPSYNSFTFILKDNSRLDELRQALEDVGFKCVEPGQRSTSIAVIDDEMYISITKSMERQIRYVGALYYALYALAGIVGAVLAWLMLSSRRKEIANMRALGTQGGRIIANFLFEQIVLSALGLALGVALQLPMGGMPNRLQLILTAAFFAVWCLSTLISLIVGFGKKTMASLSEPE